MTDWNAVERQRWGGPSPWAGKDSRTEAQKSADAPEPVGDEARELLAGALAEADAALGSDSSDAEHDALYSVRATIAGILGVTTDPPSPYYDWDEET